MSLSHPSPNIAAVLETENALITIKERPIPTPGPHELLIRNHAIAANPVDWKIQSSDSFLKKYPTVLGSDVCGTIVSIGPNSNPKFKPGDRVTGFSAVIYNKNIDHGAWQTYTILRDIATTRIPDTMSFEEGSVFPMAFATAAVAIFVDLEIPKLVSKESRNSNGSEAIIIWGGSSSVGTAAIQIAKTLGFKVFATASPSNHEFVRSLGATEVFDYRSPDVVADILAAAKKYGVVITKGFDAISENGSPKLASDVIAGGGKGGKLVLALPWPADILKPERVEVLNTAAFRLGTDREDLGAWFFNEWLEEAMETRDVVPAPRIQIVDGGIGATQKVFDMLKAGVSATKLVVKV